MKGRKRTPTTILKLRGSRWAKARANEPEPPAGRPEPPEFIRKNKVAMAEWEAILPQLEAMNTLAIVHRMLIANYCLCVARLAQAQAFIDKKGTSYDTPSGRKKYPEVVIVEKCTEQIKAYMAEMCITQASQSRGRPIGADEPPKDAKKKRFFAS